MNAKVIINDDAHFYINMDDDATSEAFKISEELNIKITDKIDL